MHDDLMQQVQDLLVSVPEGMPEHTLLKRLQANNPDDFPDTLFRDDLLLFKAHFLLFHALYRLQERLLAAGRFGLEIDVRLIRLLPLTEAAGTAVTAADPMRDYYLDLTNLNDTTAVDVEKMLGRFWGRYLANDQRTSALAVLGLAPDVDLATAQQRYRQLAMLHHPDRGGDAERFQQIQSAMATLKRC